MRCVRERKHKYKHRAGEGEGGCSEYLHEGGFFFCLASPVGVSRLWMLVGDGRKEEGWEDKADR